MTRGHGVIALGLVLLAFALRTRQIGVQSFWWDEAYSAVLARGSLSEIVTTIAREDFHPPLHYFVLHFWRLAAGESEYALRLVSAFAGTAAVALAIATGRRLFSPVSGLVAGLLFALSPFLLYYSTEARMFALAAFLALLCLYLAHRAVFSGGRLSWTGLAVAVAVSLYNYYYSLFILMPVGLLGLARPRRAPGLVVAVGAAALAYLPWLPVLFGRTVEWSSPWTPPTTPGRVLRWTVPALLTGIPDVALWEDASLRAAMAALVGLLALGVLASLVMRSTARSRWSLVYAAAAAALPLLGMAAVALYRPIFHPRYAMPAAPGLLLVAAGVLVLPSRWMLPLRAALLVALAAAFGFGLVRYADGAGLTRDDYRSAVAWINQTQAPGDVAIYNAPPGFRYYYRGTMPHQEFPGAVPYEPIAVADALNALSVGHARLWYLTHDLRPSDPEGFVAAQLDRRASLVERRDFGPIKVGLYALPSPARFGLPSPRDLGALRIGTGLELRSVAVDSEAHPSGGELPLILRWRVNAPVDEDLGMWVQLVDDQGFRWGRGDRQPRDASFRLSSAWRVESEVTTGHSLPIAVGTPPGTYRLELGVYRLRDLRTLPVTDAQGQPRGESVQLGTVRVGPASTTRESRTDLGGVSARLDASVELVGSGISAAEAPAGGQVELTAMWRALAAPGSREVLARLVGDDGRVATERRLAPGAGRYPSDVWRPGELVRDQLRLPIPPTLPDGRYRVRLGLPRAGGEEPVAEIGTLLVTGVARTFDRPQIERTLDVSFQDGVRLAGYAVDDSTPGKIGLTLLWHPSGTPRREYKSFNHALDTSGEIAGQRDAVPVDGTRPTTGWLAGEYVLDRHVIELARPAAILRVGLYDPSSGERLSTTAGEDHVDLSIQR